MKRHAWKIVAALLVLLIATFGTAWWALQSRATAVFERYEQRSNELMAGVRARAWPRPRLFGPAKPGDGWAAYEQALIGFGAIPDAEAEELRTIQDGPDYEPDLLAIEEFFERHAPLVEQLRESQRRTGFAPTYRYENGFNMQLPNVSHAIRTARILSARATHFHDSGRRVEALDSIVLGIGVGHDTARGGVIVNLLVQYVCEGVEALALRELLEDHEFKPDELERFAGQLDQLWETRPALGPVIDAEEASTDAGLTAWGLHGTSPGLNPGRTLAEEFRTNWRYLYSQRLACAGALGDMSRMFEAWRSSAPLAPHRRGSAFIEAMAGLDMDRNPISAQLKFSMDHLYRQDCIARLHLEMMRVSVALARFELDHGTAPARLDDLVPRYIKAIPACPLTGLPLGYRPGMVWSAGRNGVDDGGTPGPQNDVDDQTGDYVWKVSHRKK